MLSHGGGTWRLYGTTSRWLSTAVYCLPGTGSQQQRLHRRECMEKNFKTQQQWQQQQQQRRQQQQQRQQQQLQPGAKTGQNWSETWLRRYRIEQRLLVTFLNCQPRPDLRT